MVLHLSSYRAYAAYGPEMVFGGFTGTESLASSESTDGETPWGQLWPDLPVAVHQHCVLFFGFLEYMVIGGIQNGKASNRTFYFSLDQNEWYEGPELNVPRSGAGCGAIDNNGHVIVAGGYNDDGHLHTSEVNFTYIRVANLPKLTVTLFLALSRSPE